MLEKLKKIYCDKTSFVMEGIDALVKKYNTSSKEEQHWVTQNDVVLITYGDSITDEGRMPLTSLNDFLVKYVEDTIKAVHILPCFPYTSDDGFSVVDYRRIDPQLGRWTDIERLSKHYNLMLDAVINHVSAKSDWFQKYLNGDEKYKDYFIEADPTLDYSSVTRPRTLPLLTEFDTASGKKHIWTTFSSDQIDLNFNSPELFLEILDILALYTSKGARFIRLDAIGFMMKKIGTTCMHLEETHLLIQVMREFIDAVAPGTIIITETNVPHKDNISYFGTGNEAQMVYQFPLPPLTLYSFYTQNTKKLMNWIDTFEPNIEGTTFFNFLASHDGIGIRPTEGILTREEQQMMCDKVQARGGLYSSKDNGDGTKSPYELNVNYMDALSDLNEPDDIRAQRLLAAHAILLSLIGMPAIYYHSLLGSRNDRKAANESGIARRINREKLDYNRLCDELSNEGIRKTVFSKMCELIKVRKSQTAFSPNATQKTLYLDERLFSILRIDEKLAKKSWLSLMYQMIW